MLALKGNHGKLHEQVGEFFKVAEQYQYRALDAKLDERCEKDHGRIESRRVVALSSAHLEQAGAWAGIEKHDHGGVGPRDGGKTHQRAAVLHQLAGTRFQANWRCDSGPTLCT